MKFLLLQAGMLLLALNFVFAQNEISGFVTDADDNPLADVNVYISSLSRGTNTDRFGKFLLRNVEPGTYEVAFTSIGFQALTITVNVMATGAEPIRIELQPGQVLLSDVVVSDQTTSEINSISQLDINLRPINTSHDILRLVPGLFIAQHAGGGKAEQIFLRGFDIDHGTDVNLEVDGLPVNMVSHAHGQGYSDLHFLIPELVKKVDFNKGPYYADKGNFTTAGYVSFQTSESLDRNMIKVEGGMFGTVRNANAIRLIDESNGEWKSNAYVASEFFRTDGYFDRHQHFNRLNLMARYNASRNEREKLSIGLSTFDSRWDASGQIPLRAVKDGSITRFGAIDPTEGGETSRTNAWLRHVKVQNNGGVFDNQVYFSKYDFYLVSNFTFFLNDPDLGDQITQSESRKIWGYKGNYTLDTSLGTKSLRTEVGGGFRYDDVNDIHLYRTLSRKHYLFDIVRGDVDETNLHAYVNETLFLTPHLSVNASARVDHFTFNYINALRNDYARESISKTIISPKLSVSFDASRNVNLFLKTGVGFHSNDTRVVIAQGGEDILPKAYGVDVGANVKIGDKLLLSTALWLLDLEQEFVYVGDEGIVEPSGETQRQGIDLSVRYHVLPWLFIDSDLNITNPKAEGVPKGEDYIPLAPKLTSIGGLSARFGNGFNASIRYRYLGDRPANEDNSTVAEGYFLLDAVMKYSRKSFELSLTAENILDRQWNEAQFDTESRLQLEAAPVSEIHFTPGTPLSVRAGISVLF